MAVCKRSATGTSMARPADVLALMEKANRVLGETPAARSAMAAGDRVDASGARQLRRCVDAVGPRLREMMEKYPHMLGPRMRIVWLEMRRRDLTKRRQAPHVRRPVCSRARESRRTAPGRHQGSRRGTSRSAGGGSSGDPDPSDSAEPELGLHLWRHPRFGSCSPNLLRVLVGEVGS